MPKMTATRALRYRGEIISAGGTFEPTDAEANEFAAKKYATRAVTAKAAVDKATAETRAGYQRRDMQATTAAVEPTAPPARAPRVRESEPVGAVGTADVMGTPKE